MGKEDFQYKTCLFPFYQNASKEIKKKETRKPKLKPKQNKKNELKL